MDLVEHLNIYFGYEAKNMKEFIADFKEEFDSDDEEAVTGLLMFLNSYSKTLNSHSDDNATQKQAPQ